MEKIPNNCKKNLYKVSINSTVPLYWRIYINIPTLISIKRSQLKERFCLNPHFHQKTTGFLKIASRSKVLWRVFGNFQNKYFFLSPADDVGLEPKSLPERLVLLRCLTEILTETNALNSKVHKTALN